MARQKKVKVEDRIEIREQLQGCSVEIEYNTFEGIIANLQSIQNDPKNAKYHRFVIEMRGIEYDDSDKEYPYPFGYRWETDEERDARLQMIREQEAARIARDREQFERLKIQFEGRNHLTVVFDDK